MCSGHARKIPFSEKSVFIPSNSGGPKYVGRIGTFIHVPRIVPTEKRAKVKYPFFMTGNKMKQLKHGPT